MKKALSLILISLILVGGWFMYRAYQMIQAPNVKESQEEWTIKIPEESDFRQLMLILKASDLLQSENDFVRVSKWMDFGDRIRPGNYRIKGGMSNRTLVNLLRSGSQSPIRLTINGVRMLPNLAAKMASQMAADSIELLGELTSDATLRLFETKPENVLTYFIPNTYEVFWNDSPKKLMDRFKEEHTKFWSSNGRLERAEALGMNPEEVYTLASIVEKETLQRDELRIVAGLYLNRLDIGMPLQADPTVVFANQQFDLRRVLNKHLAIDSPYNTYKHAGLPPGPICMPSIAGIEAVLSGSNHKLLYMCASVEGGGRHAFAESIHEHGRNARAYHNWLDQQGIR